MSCKPRSLFTQFSASQLYPSSFILYPLLLPVSYQVIARKWRPQTFEEVTGQEVVTHSLRNAIEFDRLHHAYIFSGARGVGKTTTARIIAKALNCHRSDKPTLTPCRTDDPDACSSCREIAESRSIDVLEIDAASHTGIGDIRGTILDGININPARDRYKIFIIDEVHQLSKPAFNALLKTLEEPPGNVIFIMATTELHKVPETILSRCQEFQFRTIPIQKIFDRLKLIASEDKINVTEDALREIARSGMGSMRDAQSNFDQVISFSGEQIEAQDVTKALGSAGVEVLSSVIKSIANGDTKTILDLVDDLIGHGHDLRNFCRDLLALMRDLMVYKVASGSEHLFESAVFSVEQMNELAAGFTTTDLLRYFNSLAATEVSLREAAQPRFVLEIGLVKLIEMRKAAAIEDILNRLSAIEIGTPQTAPAAATQEKKTLIPEKTPAEPRKTAVPEPPKPVIPDKTQQTATPAKSPPAEPENTTFDSIVEPPDDEIGFDDGYVTHVPEPSSEPASEAAITQPTWTVTPMRRLASIASEDLEHFDVPRLDDAYEWELKGEDDQLLPINGASHLADILSGKTVIKPPAAEPSAPLKKIDLTGIMPEYENDDAVEIPTLSDDPTVAELITYANALPDVRRAKRLLRADVIHAVKN